MIDYTILFQNTGSASAKNVHLELVISDKINPLTINPLSASATYNWVMIDSLLIVDFFNINLPDSTTNPIGSIKYFSFRAQQKYPINMTRNQSARSGYFSIKFSQS
ncbi:MAG: hypothetical protein U0T32_00590 [Chitinophagales bacterium]